jgi:non-canonical poly(A) RNA polymerase PAPD5/7
LINENNINNIEIRNNLNIENNSPHSSDIGENVEEELKDKIKNGNHKENKNLSKNFINFQNNNNNSNNINKFNIKKLKNKLNLAQSNKTFSSKLNFEIPIELINAPSHINKKDLEYFYLKNNYKKNLNNYMKISNAPTFYFDISDKSIETEMKLDELETILTEKENSIKNFEEKIKDQDNLIKKCKLMLQEREKNLNIYKNYEEEYLKKISELQEEKKNLSNQLPKEKFEKDSKKNKSYKEYREFKFKPAKIDDNYIIHILQKDLIDYQNYVQELIMKKKRLVEDLILKVTYLINEISYDFDVKLDGSYANNLSLPWSNIDIILINKNPQNRTEMALIQKLFINMKNKDWIKKYLFEEPIKKMFPVIKILTVDKYLNINIDISFQDDFKYIQMKINLINKFLKENAVLKPLMLALKTILKNANLNNPNSGGLSSYGLILMIVSYIQNQKENNIFSENDEDFLGKIFYGFLQHYGLAFDFGKYVILTYPNNLDNGNNINFGQNNHELIIIDPLDKNNNVAKNTKQFMNLKMAFMIAFMITKEDCECGCHYGRALYEYSLTGTEHCILKRMFNSVKRFSENSN